MAYAPVRKSATERTKQRTKVRTVHYYHYYYVVQPGDMLSGVAYAFTGRAGNFRYLAGLNGIPNANYIVPGEVIRID